MLAGLILGQDAAAHPANSPHLEIGAPAPAFSAPNERRIPTSWEVFKGKQGLLLIFLSKTEVQQLPALTKIQLGEVGVLLIDVTKRGTMQLIAANYKKAGNKHPLRFDQKRAIAHLYDVDKLPSVFLLDEKLNLAWMARNSQLDPALITKAIEVMTRGKSDSETNQKNKNKSADNPISKQ